MRNQQQGFTLIELVAVIVILGALAVVALPRFVNLQDEARQAGAEGVAGGLGSGSAVNFAAALASDDGGVVDVTSCAETPNTLQSGAMPNGYSVNTSGTATGVTTAASGEQFTCNVVNLDSNSTASATFSAIYVDSSDF